MQTALRTWQPPQRGRHKHTSPVSCIQPVWLSDEQWMHCKRCCALNNRPNVAETSTHYSCHASGPEFRPFANSAARLTTAPAWPKQALITHVMHPEGLESQASYGRVANCAAHVTTALTLPKQALILRAMHSAKLKRISNEPWTQCKNCCAHDNRPSAGSSGTSDELWMLGKPRCALDSRQIVAETSARQS